MTKVSFQDNRVKAEKEFNIGKGDKFKPAEGANKIRLVSECLPHESIYMGKTTFKWLCQVLDRKDGKIKPYFMPHTIYKEIEALQISDDYKFDEVPMPYDLTINATGAGSKEVKYTVVPARLNSALTAEEAAAIFDAPTVQDLQKKIREKEVEGNQEHEDEEAPLPEAPPAK